MKPKVSRKLLYELSSNVEGKSKRPTVTMVKGLPDEYKILLERAKLGTNNAVSNTWRECAKLYVPQLYKCLRNNGYPPNNAAVIVKDDAKSIWTLDHVLEFLPDEGKDAKRQKAGRKSAEKRKEIRSIESKKFKESVKDVLPTIEEIDEEIASKFEKIGENNIRKAVGLANASEEIRQRVAASGGDATHEKYGSEHYREMGKTGMEHRWKTISVLITPDDHAQIVRAYKRSDNGEYNIYIRDGKFDYAEPITK